MLTTEKKNIPLNENSYYIIKKGDWSSTIDILLSNYLNFNILNLFMIIKSYFNEQHFYVEDIYLIISKEDNFSIIFKKIDYDVIKSCTYDEFLIFFEKIIYSEKEYLKNYKYLGFKIIFNKTCPIFKDNKIYPKYPWNEDIIDYYTSKSKQKIQNTNFLLDREEVLNLKKKLKDLENENRKLLNIIEFLRKK